MIRLTITCFLVLTSIGIAIVPRLTARETPTPTQQTFTLDTLTIYNPTTAQCDADPLITASNAKINLNKLRKGSIRWIALSRDMLKRWGGKLHYRDTVILTSGDSTIDGIWIIHDTMNKRYRNRGDLLFDESVRTRGRWTNVTLKKKL